MKYNQLMPLVSLSLSPVLFSSSPHWPRFNRLICIMHRKLRRPNRPELSPRIRHQHNRCTDSRLEGLAVSEEEDWPPVVNNSTSDMRPPFSHNLSITRLQQTDQTSSSSSSNSSRPLRRMDCTSGEYRTTSQFPTTRSAIRTSFMPTTRTCTRLISQR